jgi:ABC-type Mn2+/Zn2+ transport system ATPase subunit
VTHDVNAALVIIEKAYVLNKTVISEGTLFDVFSYANLLKKEDLDQSDIKKLFVKVEPTGHKF